MTIESLSYLNETISNLVEYEFGRYSGKQLTYFVGELSGGDMSGEDNHENTTFIINGVSYESYMKLMEGFERIQNELHRKRKILENGNLLYFLVKPCFQVPIEDIEVKKMQMNITVNEWRVM